MKGNVISQAVGCNICEWIRQQGEGFIFKRDFYLHQKILCNQMEEKRHRPFWKDFGLAQSPTVVVYWNKLEIHTVLPGAVLYFHFENYKLVKIRKPDRFLRSTNLTLRVYAWGSGDTQQWSKWLPKGPGWTEPDQTPDLYLFIPVEFANCHYTWMCKFLEPEFRTPLCQSFWAILVISREG